MTERRITKLERAGARTQLAARLMLDFAERTGLIPGKPEQRYLWTDAFAVCNYLGLARATGDDRFADLALRLIDQVHHVLGRHRADDRRSGWISGLEPAEAERHPTRGGLRIGKILPERPAGEPLDEEVEWDRDGQYFHYLAQWMHALDQASRATGDPRFNLWARELAGTAHDAFSQVPRGGGHRRLAWKMSIDLSRPLVASTGQHDAVDGLVACAELEATAARFGGEPSGPSLARELAGFASMSSGADWVTSDPLGIGGLLLDGCRLAGMGELAPALSRDLFEAALTGLGQLTRRQSLSGPASQRLAFRELGLAIGLGGVELLRSAAAAGLTPLLERFRPYSELRPALEGFWLEPPHQQTRPWLEHRDINEVMLATSLAPEGYLLTGPGSEGTARGSSEDLRRSSTR